MLPSDDAILLSMMNMYLRDGDLSLEEAAEKMGGSLWEIEKRLRAFGYEYVPAQNAFRPAP